MQNDEPEALETALRALRGEYLYEAPERIRELSAALGRLRAGDASGLDDLHRYFHRLAGSGGSYGFPEITESGRAAEHAVVRMVGETRTLQREDFEALDAHVLRVAEVFQMAQRQFDAGGPPAE
jgi:HPt (histidine-containing phosphotransfer) domain-containing protein